MLVVFRTKASADLLMFGDAAVTLLKLMGQSGELPGALVADDVPAALERLRSAVTARGGEASPAPGAVTPQDEPQLPVSLKQRAFPLIKLLEAAVKRKADVIWEQAKNPLR